ncbi:MAG: hypothetical protein ACRENA_02285 [Vulcanimicrobiaceae bacterium]
MSLLEGVAAAAIVVVAAIGAFGATLAGSHVVAAPAARDAALVAARNAAVDARAASAYDASAAAAILSAPGVSWTAGSITLRSSVDAQMLSIVATSGTESAGVNYPVAREALPQGTIVDMSGNVLSR